VLDPSPRTSRERYNRVAVLVGCMFERAREVAGPRLTEYLPAAALHAIQEELDAEAEIAGEYGRLPATEVDAWLQARVQAVVAQLVATLEQLLAQLSTRTGQLADDSDYPLQAMVELLIETIRSIYGEQLA
jgi:hypothetical protein